MDETLALTRELIARPSVTPEDAGCQQILSNRLTKAGFCCTNLPFGEVRNLWARRGKKSPLLAFVGHTDVVPTGPLDSWDGCDLDLMYAFTLPRGSRTG